MDRDAAVEALRAAARALAGGDDREIVRAAQRAQDALDAVKAEHLARLEGSAGFELDGASSLTAWSRQHLRLEPGETKALVRSVRTLRDLPVVAEAADAGRVRAAHLAWFAYGVRHVGADLMREAQSWLLDVAVTCPPSDLRRLVRSLREAVHPDALDAAWAKGMEREDLQVNAVPDGWFVTGFLNTVTGAKLRTLLESLTAPREADDPRTGAQRRVDGLDALLTSVLESGLPSDKGVRPHLSVLVDAETLAHAASDDPHEGGSAPAELVGFGAIGRRLLTYLGCLGDTTALTTGPGPLGRSAVLDVGRSHRLATLKQRRAIHAQQSGTCAAPGCRNTHLEIHHITPWSHGGRTDLAELVGLCARCHRLVHRDLLQVVKHRSGAVTFLDRNQQVLRSSELTRRAARRHAHHVRRVAREVHRRREREPYPLTG